MKLCWKKKKQDMYEILSKENGDVVEKEKVNKEKIKNILKE